MKEVVRKRILEHPLIPVILELASSRGERVFLVGGAIRDMALGLRPKDLDFATQHPFQTARFFAERYEASLVPLGKDAVPTYRIPLPNILLDWVGIEGGTIIKDLSLRDFTVNAIAYDPEKNEFHDPTGGFRDLKAGIIRMAYSSSFEDDPLRILKAYRMFSEFPSFKLDDVTAGTIADHCKSLSTAAPERIRNELERLFMGTRPGESCRHMADSGVLFVVFPELEELADLKQNDYHHTDALNHSLEALLAMDGNPSWLSELGIEPFSRRKLYIIRLSLLLHDLGKADTRSVGEDGRVHFFGHSKFSADKARTALSRLRFSRADVQNVYDLCLNHLRPLALVNTSPRKKAVRRLIHSMGENLQPLLALSYADKLASRGKEYEENLASLKKLSHEVMQTLRDEGETIRSLPKLVDGLEAMSILRMDRPGPALGKALDYLLDRQVDGTVNTAGEAAACLREWGRKHL